MEAKTKARSLTAQDIEDVHTLLAQEAKNRGRGGGCGTTLFKGRGPVMLVRQVLINLALNALQAAEKGTNPAVMSACTPC